jgi:pimeloyl-ACP methyl ester carboxylesterase
VKLFLPGERTVRYWSSASDGPIVLFFHGCPDSRRIAMTGAAAAQDVGVRLLAFNRPGYGSSTPGPTTHTSVAHLAAEILDVWRIDRVAVLGMSVGGSYAAAFAASYPERTTSLGLVSAQAMVETDSEGTVEDAVERLRPEFMAWRAKIDPDDEDDAALAARFLAELPEADARALRDFDDEFVAYLAFESLVKPEGYLRDAALLFRTWDYDPAAISCPVSVWVGDHDEQAVIASTWWAGRLPKAQLEVLTDTTHLAALVSHWPAILTRLGTGTG